MNLAEAIAEVRGRLDDRAPPYLWPTPDLIRWINEAENEAAYRSRLLHDSTTPSIVEIPIAAGESTYPLDCRVFAIDTVVLDSTSLPLRRTWVSMLDDDCPRWRRTEGTPRQFIESEGAIQLYPKPVATDLLRLSVWRYPLRPMAADTDVPEIQRIEHSNMLDWVYHLAYSRRDSDTDDDTKAAEYEAKFTAKFGPRETADVYRKRRRRAPIIVKPTW